MAPGAKAAIIWFDWRLSGSTHGHLQSADRLSCSMITGQTGKGQGEHDLANNTWPRHLSWAVCSCLSVLLSASFEEREARLHSGALFSSGGLQISLWIIHVLCHVFFFGLILFYTLTIPFVDTINLVQRLDRSDPEISLESITNQHPNEEQRTALAASFGGQNVVALLLSDFGKGFVTTDEHSSRWRVTHFPLTPIGSVKI